MTTEMTSFISNTTMTTERFSASCRHVKNDSNLQIRANEQPTFKPSWHSVVEQCQQQITVQWFRDRHK